MNIYAFIPKYSFKSARNFESLIKQVTAVAVSDIIERVISLREINVAILGQKD